MNTHNDFEEFLRLLNSANVEYVIVGGYAVAFHGYVRATNDLDILFRVTRRNVRGIRDALIVFGFPEDAIDPEVFLKPGNIVRMGTPPCRIELLNKVSGITFGEIWAGKVPGAYGAVDVNFIGKDDLVRNKRAAGRPKDLADVDELT